MTLCANCFMEMGEGAFCGNCGYNNLMPVAGNAAPLRRFCGLKNNRYTIGRVLGIGGFGITYVARDNLAMNRKIAIKEYYPSGIAERDELNGRLRFGDYAYEFNTGLRNFVREARTLAMLNGGRAESVVRVHEFFYENDTGYMVMEYIEGQSLSQLAQVNNGRIPYERAYCILTEMMEALQRLHAEGVLHRDISPENIIMQPDGRLRLIDFGAARTARNAGHTAKMIMLRPGFAPPEQYDANGDQGPWTDVYALACTFYRLVGGKKLPDAMQRRGGETVTPLHSLMPDVVPERVSNAIEKAMELDSGKRYRSMSEFMEAIEIPAETTDHVGLIERIRGLLKPVAEITVLETGETKHLKRNGVITVGRSKDCDLVTMNNGYIGRVHCNIYFDSSEQAVKVECKSANGIQTKGGINVKNGEAITLYENETTLRLANTESRIRVVYQ